MAKRAIAERVAVVSGPGASFPIADDASHREGANRTSSQCARASVDEFPLQFD